MNSTTLHKLIGWKSATFLGFLFFETNTILVWLKLGGEIQWLRKNQVIKWTKDMNGFTCILISSIWIRFLSYYQKKFNKNIKNGLDFIILSKKIQ